MCRKIGKNSLPSNGHSGNFQGHIIGHSSSENLPQKRSPMISIGVSFGLVMGILSILMAIYFTSDFVSKNLSSDGVLEKITIFKINFIRITFIIIGATGFSISALYLFRPGLYYFLKTKIAEIPLCVRVLFLIDLALCYMHLIVHQYATSDFIINLFNLAHEANIPSWYSSIKLFCISLLAGFFAYRKFNKSDIRSWLLFSLPFLFLTLSMDESAGIHEWLGFVADGIILDTPRQNTIFPMTGIWMFVLGIPFVVFFLLIMFSVKNFFFYKKNEFIQIMFGMMIFLSGALGVEILSNFAQIGLYSILQNFFEEFLEMVGVTFIFFGFYRLSDLHTSSLAPLFHDHHCNLIKLETLNKLKEG